MAEVRMRTRHIGGSRHEQNSPGMNETGSDADIVLIQDQDEKDSDIIDLTDELNMQPSPQTDIQIIEAQVRPRKRIRIHHAEQAYYKAKYFNLLRQHESVTQQQLQQVQLQDRQKTLQLEIKDRQIAELQKQLLEERQRKDQITCKICWEGIQGSNRQYLATICGHIFCEDCLKQSLAHKKQCPVCRKSIKLSTCRRLYGIGGEGPS